MIESVVETGGFKMIGNNFFLASLNILSLGYGTVVRCTSFFNSGLFVDYIPCSGFMRIQGAKKSHILVILQQS